MTINDPKLKTKFRIQAAVEEIQAAGDRVTIAGVAKRVQLTGLSGVRAHLLALERDGLIKLKRGAPL